MDLSLSTNSPLLIYIQFNSNQTLRRIVLNQEKIVLDIKSFAALSSKSRISILKKLDTRCMTITELSKGESLAKSTVHEHLNKLHGAGLVKKKDGNHKWTYYELTEKGKIILHPRETKKILILLSSFIISFVGGFAYVVKFIKTYFLQNGYPPMEGIYDKTFYLLIGFVLILASMSFLYYSLRSYK